MGNQPIILGGFYSAVEDQFLPGTALWTSSDVDEYKYTVHHPKQETRWTGYLSEDETFAMLGIDGGGTIGIDIKIGKLEGSGSFEFLTQYKDYKYMTMATLHFFS